MTTAPHDASVEEAFIGGCLALPYRLVDYVGQLQGEDFYVPKHRALWLAMVDLHARGEVITEPNVADRALRFGTEVTWPDLMAMANAGVPPNPTACRILRRHRTARELQAAASEILGQIEDGGDPESLVQQALGSMAACLRPLGSQGPEATTMETLFAETVESSPWVLPGLIRRDWRVVLVASEGLGKSTLLRLLAIAAAQGINPLWPTERMDPVRALIVDLENPRAAIVETAERMVEQARRVVGAEYDPERLKVWRRPRGIDLRSPVDAAALEREIVAHQPTLVCLGPLYKASRGRSGERYEESAAGVQDVLDDLRTRYGFALVLEHHAAKASHGYRAMEPEGSAWWLRWPELGLTLHAKEKGSGLTVGKYRLHRLQADWPDELARSDEWVWTGLWNKARVSNVGDMHDVGF